MPRSSGRNLAFKVIHMRLRMTARYRRQRADDRSYILVTDTGSGTGLRVFRGSGPGTGLRRVPDLPQFMKYAVVRAVLRRL